MCGDQGEWSTKALRRFLVYNAYVVDFLSLCNETVYHLASQGLMQGGNLSESQIVTHNDVVTYFPKRKHVPSPHPFCDPLYSKQVFGRQRQQLVSDLSIVVMVRKIVAFT